MKKLTKLRLKRVASVELTADQMKKIVGGSGGCNASSCGGSCSVKINNLTYSGSCSFSSSSGYLRCGCKV